MSKLITDDVQRLVRRYGTRDPIELIGCLGIERIEHQTPGGLKGFFAVVLREKYIFLNADLGERDRLVVAAHELGHSRLHEDLARVFPLRDFSLYSMMSKAEYEANMFCAELLIPDEKITDCIAEQRDYFELCAEVGYQPQLVTFKLYSMMQRGYPIRLPDDPESRFLGK